MSSFKINISGEDDVKRALKEIPVQAAKIIEEELAGFGRDTVEQAKRLSPIDDGVLRGKIEAVPGTLSMEIVVAVNYAAYVEFGTRKFAAKYVSSLPKEWQEFAAKFKGGGGGNFEELVMRITEWVIRKKIGATYNTKTKRRDRVGKQSAKTTSQADAYAIALHIVRNGIRPHPFLYPAIQDQLPILKQHLKERLNA